MDQLFFRIEVFGFWAAKWRCILNRGVCNGEMAPRFVEVARPVEEGVAWASSLTATVSSRLRALIPENATDAIMQNVNMVYENVPNIKFASDFQSAVNDFVDFLPEARNETRYLLLTAVAAAVLRWLFLVLTSRSILATYGTMRIMKKEQ